MNYVTPFIHVSLPLCWRSLPNSWVTILCLSPMLVCLKVPYLTIFSIHILSQGEHLSPNINMYDSKFTTVNWSSHSNSRSCVSTGHLQLEVPTYLSSTCPRKNASFIILSQTHLSILGSRLLIQQQTHLPHSHIKQNFRSQHRFLIPPHPP